MRVFLSLFERIRFVLVFITVDFYVSGLRLWRWYKHCQGFLFLTLSLLDPLKHTERGFAAWIAARVEAYRNWRERSRALAELRTMRDRELFDVGLNRGDLGRIFNDRLNQDLLARGRTA